MLLADLQSMELRLRRVAAACTTEEEARNTGSTLGRLLAAKLKDIEADASHLHQTHRMKCEAALINLSRDNHTIVAAVADAALAALKAALHG